MTDYSMHGKPIFKFNCFQGKFPKKLETIFPWPSFFESTQASFLMKEEYICGTFGIEARYPFLDKQVVQEFLSLSHHIKNSQYKSSITKLSKTK